MSHNVPRKRMTGNHVKVTARHKIRRIEKELTKLAPLASARKAVDRLQQRLEFWKKFV